MLEFTVSIDKKFIFIKYNKDNKVFNSDKNQKLC